MFTSVLNITDKDKTETNLCKIVMAGYQQKQGYHSTQVQKLNGDN